MIYHVLINCILHSPMTTLVQLPCNHTKLLAAHTPIWDRKTPQMKQDLYSVHSAKPEPDNTLWMLTKHPNVWQPAKRKTQKTSSRGVWADHGSENVTSHHSKSEQKPQSSQHQRPAELPWVIKYNVRCFKVFIDTLKKYFLSRFFFPLSFYPEEHSTLHPTLLIN